jgi:hypothetical protein
MITDVDIVNTVTLLRGEHIYSNQMFNMLMRSYDLIERYVYATKGKEIKVLRVTTFDPLLIDIALNSAIKYYTERGVLT